MISQCPGQDDRNIQAESIQCAQCGYTAEIFSDEVKVYCPQCKNFICRQRLPSCVDWCMNAKVCIGDEAYKLHEEVRRVTLREKLLLELEGYFGFDAKRINHGKKVLGFAEEILKEENADWHIVIPASILHDVGIKVAEEKYGSNAGNLQEQEGPAVARKILFKYGVRKDQVEEICAIIGSHHTPGKIKSKNFEVLYDADLLVNLKDECDFKNKEALKKVIGKSFLTQTGRVLAEKLYLSNGTPA